MQNGNYASTTVQGRSKWTLDLLKSLMKFLKTHNNFFRIFYQSIWRQCIRIHLGTFQGSFQMQFLSWSKFICLTSNRKCNTNSIQNIYQALTQTMKYDLYVIINIYYIWDLWPAKSLYKYRYTSFIRIRKSQDDGWISLTLCLQECNSWMFL